MSSKKIGLSIGRALLLVLLVLIFIGALGIFLYLQAITLVSFWLPLCISVVIAAVIGTVTWRWWHKLTEIASFALNFSCNLIFVAILFTSFFYLFNYIGAKRHEPRKEQSYITSKYRERHYRSRRIGKNRYVRGEPYYEYYITVTLPNGGEKALELPYSTYSGLRSDSDIVLSISKGWLGADVIMTDYLPSDNPLQKTKRRRCRFVGRKSSD